MQQAKETYIYSSFDDISSIDEELEDLDLEWVSHNRLILLVKLENVVVIRERKQNYNDSNYGVTGRYNSIERVRTEQNK